jgi:hypothetical protein
LSSIRLDIEDEGPRTSDLVTRMGGQNDDHSNTPIVHNGIGLTSRGFNIHREYGIVIFIDVLGIKGIWKKRPAINVVNDWKSVVRSFMDSIDNNPPNSGHHLRVLSDTIIIAIPGPLNYSIINRAFDLLLEPFIHSLKIGMLLRGIISHGEYYLSNELIIGEALDDAASNHNKLKWIGISLSPSLSDRKNETNIVRTNSAVMYDNIPLKDRPYRGLALNWPFHDTREECIIALQHKKNDSDPSIKEKHDNTCVFYQRCRR